MAGLPGIVTSTSYTPPETMTFPDWEKTLALIRNISNQHMWWLGDAINWGSARWGEKYSQALEATDYDYDTLAKAAFVAKKFPPLRRRNGLSFNHHRELAGMDEVDQDMWLDRCEGGTLSVHGLRDARRSNAKAALAKGGDDASHIPTEAMRIFRLMPKEAMTVFVQALDDPSGSAWMQHVALPDGRSADVTVSVQITGKSSADGDQPQEDDQLQDGIIPGPMVTT